MPGSDSVHDDDIEFVDRTARAGRASRAAALEKVFREIACLRTAGVFRT
jgi:hypothetical protein